MTNYFTLLYTRNYAITNYIIIAAEARYHQQMAKLAKNTQSALEELNAQEPCLPLLDVFRTSVDQVTKSLHHDNRSLRNVLHAFYIIICTYARYSSVPSA